MPSRRFCVCVLSFGMYSFMPLTRTSRKKSSSSADTPRSSMAGCRAELDVRRLRKDDEDEV